MDIQTNFKIARIKAGFSQREVAKRLFVSPTVICYYETKRLAPLDIAIELADMYNISLDELVGRNYERNKE